MVIGAREAGPVEMDMSGLSWLCCDTYSKMDGRGRKHVNLLSLDGGGVRGYSELVILDKIMRGVQERLNLIELPKPCDYFDLIGGTSTGGLVAILLGRLRLSTEEALKEYDNFGEIIFSKDNKRYKGMDPIYAKYDAGKLVEVVKGITERLQESPLMKNPDGDPSSGKCVVFTVNADNLNGPARRLRGYKHQDNWDSGVEIWQAARATSAAPGFFESITINGTRFVDAALGYNNPISEVLDEAGQILPRSATLGCILSLGTGSKGDSVLPDGSGVRNKAAYIKGLGAVAKNSITTTEPYHQDMERRFAEFKDSYFRFNVPNAAAEVKLDHYQKMKELREMTDKYLGWEELGTKERVEKIIDILAGDKSEGLKLGQACAPNRAQMIMDDGPTFQPRGIVSNFFTGRTDILEKMSNALIPEREDGSSIREFLLWGMGGVGKSQIALRFDQLYGQRLKTFWFDASSNETIHTSFQEHADGLSLGSGSGSQQRVLNFLEHADQEWLLISDNVESSTRSMATHIPKKGRGMIIYTSRFNHLEGKLPSYAVAEVRELEETDAITLFTRAARIEAVQDIRAHRETCRPIVRELGYLPLAIDQAGSYVYMTKCPLPEYLETFRSKIRQLLEEPEYHDSADKNEAVFATFDISYNVLKSCAGRYTSYPHLKPETAQLAIKILRIVCFCYRKNLLEDLFRFASRQTSSDDPLEVNGINIQDLLTVDDQGKWNPHPFRKGLQMLESFSLIKRGRDGTFSMHVLVHNWARVRLDPKEYVCYGFLARQLLYKSIAFGDASSIMRRYRQKVYLHLDYCEARVACKEGDEREAYYMTKKAQIARDQGYYEEAESAWKEAIRTLRVCYSQFDDNTLGAMKGLANFYQFWGKWREAEALALEIVACREAMRKGGVKGNSTNADKAGEEEEERPPKESKRERFKLKRVKQKLKAHTTKPSLKVVKRPKTHEEDLSDAGTDPENEPPRFSPPPSEFQNLLSAEILACTYLSTLYSETSQPLKRLAIEKRIAALLLKQRRRSTSEMSHSTLLATTLETITTLKPDLKAFNDSLRSLQVVTSPNQPLLPDFPLLNIIKLQHSSLPQPESYATEEADLFQFLKQTEERVGSPYSLNCIRLLKNISTFLMSKHRATCAILVIREAWGRCTEMFGRESYHTAEILQQFALTYFVAGQFEWAVMIQERAVRVWRGELGEGGSWLVLRGLEQLRLMKAARKEEGRKLGIMEKREREEGRDGDEEGEGEEGNGERTVITTDDPVEWPAINESMMPNACGLCCDGESHQALVDGLSGGRRWSYLPVFMEEFEKKPEGVERGKSSRELLFPRKEEVVYSWASS